MAEQVPGLGGSSRRIVAFCCEHSGYLSAQEAIDNLDECPGEVELVKLSCSGNLMQGRALKELAGGATGVIVFGCFPDACRNLKGNVRAEKRVEHVGDLLEQIDYERERVRFVHIAPNMPRGFVEEIRKFNAILDSIDGVNGEKLGGTERVKTA